MFLSGNGYGGRKKLHQMAKGANRLRKVYGIKSGWSIGILKLQRMAKRVHETVVKEDGWLFRYMAVLTCVSSC